MSGRATIIRTADVPLHELTSFPGNARRGNVDLVRESLRVNGQYRAIVVQESTGYILAGNHTWQAAQAEGWDTIKVDFVECDDDTARRINLVDNKANDDATYDERALADLLCEMPSLEGTGFAKEELDELLASLGPGGFNASEKDKIIDPPAQPVTRLGDVIELGVHRLVCGDCLDPAVRRQLSLDCHELVVTDPPYMVDYQINMKLDAFSEKRRQDGKTIVNEGLDGEAADRFATEGMAAVCAMLAPGGAFYVCSPPGPDEMRFRRAILDAGLHHSQTIIWVKDQFVFGRSDYHYRHEPMFYGWRPGAGHFFTDDRTLDTVWEVPRPKTSKAHPTMKPVDLFAKAIRHSSRKGTTVVDPFAGSGTTMVAAMQEGRRCLMVELDPGYCDVIVERYERISGEQVNRG